jgi:catechol 2,3-dioxygenase-like lactoylglutathione lyase family enzyme/ribosomal protein S18 acetylase RimI-like enzyme
MTAVELVRARPRDLGVLVDEVRAYYEFDAIAFDASAIRTGVAELLAHPELGVAWLIQRGGEVVGCCVLAYGFDLEVGGRQATVTELYLHPAHRRAGIGAAAIAHVEEHLRGLGIAGYELHVERANAGARAFYAKLGFTAHDRIPLTKRLPPAAPSRGRAVADTVDHLSLGATDLEISRRFYDAALAPLGFRARQEIAGEVGYFRTDDPEHREAFALFIGFEDPAARRPVVPSAGFHLALRAATRDAVRAFHAAALSAGGRDDGPPGVRAVYHADYFAAFVLDPDGHRIEAVCHAPAAARP